MAMGAAGRDTDEERWIHHTRKEAAEDVVTLVLRLIQPGALEADLEAALEHIALDMVSGRLDKWQCRGAHLHHIANNVALHLVAEPAPLLGRRCAQQLIPQRIDVGVLMVDLVGPELAM